MNNLNGDIIFFGEYFLNSFDELQIFQCHKKAIIIFLKYEKTKIAKENKVSIFVRRALLFINNNPK